MEARATLLLYRRPAPSGQPRIVVTSMGTMEAGAVCRADPSAAGGWRVRVRARPRLFDMRLLDDDVERVMLHVCVRDPRRRMAVVAERSFRLPLPQAVGSGRRLRMEREGCGAVVLSRPCKRTLRVHRVDIDVWI